VTRARAAAVRDALVDGAASLAASLDAQQGIYASMLELTLREEAAIVSGDVAALTRVVEEKETLIEHLNALETERMTALVAIASATGIDPDGATLSDVAAQLPREAALALTESGVELRAQALSLQEANDHNARLLRSSGDVVDRWIHYLRVLLSGALYTAGGVTAESTASHRALDRSA
jgi:flagellar biosynthesis/type III secretory pathway chaperone